MEKHTTYNKFYSLAFHLFYKESRPRDMAVFSWRWKYCRPFVGMWVLLPSKHTNYHCNQV